MPRFTLTAAEQKVLTDALLAYAIANNLKGGEALYAAAATTMNELHAVATQYLNNLRAEKVAALAAVSTNATATTNSLNADIAAIDSALGKV